MLEAQQTTPKSKGDAPDYIAYQVRDRGEEAKGFWTRIGAAWRHEDQEGLTVRLDALPLSGEVVLRIRREQEEAEATGA